MVTILNPYLDRNNATISDKKMGEILTQETILTIVAPAQFANDDILDLNENLITSRKILAIANYSDAFIKIAYGRTCTQVVYDAILPPLASLANLEWDKELISACLDNVFNTKMGVDPLITTVTINVTYRNYLA